MELIKRFRVDTLKLSTEDLPIAEADGTTCYEVDTMKLYIYYKGQWYPQEEVTTEETQEEEQNNTKIIIEEPITEKQLEDPSKEKTTIEEPIIEEPKEKIEK